MEKAVLWIFVIGCCFLFATSLKCHKCSSYKSMEECVRSMSEETCAPSVTHCRNMTVNVFLTLTSENVTVYERGCTDKEDPDCRENKCTGHFGTEFGSKYNLCQMSCCTGDLCPEGKLNNTNGGISGPEKGFRSNSVPMFAEVVPITASVFLSLMGRYFL